VSDESPAAAPRVAPRLHWGASSHRGNRRPLNEDSYLATPSAVFVADGMGGHEAGEIASALAIDALRPLSWLAVVSADELGERLVVANSDVLGIATAKGRGAGTTITGAVVAEQDGVPYWLVTNLGDSRTYHLSRELFEQVSIDHSEVQELVDAGSLTPQEAAHHPRRHVVTRALGAAVHPDADYWYLPMRSGDRLLVCSDGLTNEVDDEGIAAVLRAEADPQAACDRLLAAALEAGGRDNITVLVADAVITEGDVRGDPAGPGSGALAQDPADDDTLPREAAAPAGGGS
jgi:protein phosphatase